MIENNMKIIYGDKKIMLSAPHCVTHIRENNLKPREVKTDFIVNELANICKTYGIYKLKNENNDANWDEKCKYKEKINEIVNTEKIKTLIDIHGMAAHRNEDICIGVNNGKNLLGFEHLTELVKKTFKNYGFKNVSVDTPFDASYRFCVSNYISRNCNIPTFQIEINLKYRSSIYEDYQYFDNLILAFKEIIKLLDNAII